MPAPLPSIAPVRREPDSLVRTPVSTYRIQLQPDFGFRDAAALVEYWKAIGFGELYSSPFLRARPGSTHGYDICDHSSLNPELGSPADFAALAAALRRADLGHIADVVPNHMCIDARCNAWWRDVLKHGRSSAFASFFDIDWTPVKPELHGKVLLPILSCQYGEALEAGDLRLDIDAGAVVIRYHEHVLPIDPRTSVDVYGLDIESIGRQADDPAMAELLSILAALRHLPTDASGDPEQIAARRREAELARRRLGQLAGETDWARAHLRRAVAAFNGRPGEPRSFDRLHALLDAQAYRLAYWRASAHEINYRRFFEVDDLAALRVEDPDVFDITHRLIGSLLANRSLTGLRVDHPDGLALPREYFERLQRLAGAGLRSSDDEIVVHVVTEKILAPDQELPHDWSVHGTTGYTFLNAVNGLFVADRQLRALRRIYRRLTGVNEAFAEIVYRSKKLVMETSLASELNVLAHALNTISERNRRSRDFTLNSLRRALREFIASLSVYRTYFSGEGRTAADEARVFDAIDRARRRNPELEPTIFAFIGDVLLDPEVPNIPLQARQPAYRAADAADRQQRLAFTLKLQQYTGPVHAKGVEDTAFYRYNVLVSLNEVGGDPSAGATSLHDFHRQNLHRLAAHPLELTTTATHDTKLGEDARARIDVISEIPDRWRSAIARWTKINASCRRRVHAEWAPDRNDEYRFYQVLLGVWPADEVRPESWGAAAAALTPRLSRYMVKAAKEAKIHTSWISDHEAYDEAVRAFVPLVLEGPKSSRFLAEFAPLAQAVARAGMVNSLAQLLLKIGSPGVPDTYQGNELWDLHLVDPDNRGTVDFAHREQMLRSLAPLIDGLVASDAGDRSSEVTRLVHAWPDGRVKMLVTAAGLRVRRALRDLFLYGTYLPLEAPPHRGSEIVAFAREHQSSIAVVVAPRFTAEMTIAGDMLPIGSAWASHTIPLPPHWDGRPLRDAITGATVQAPAGDHRWLDTAVVLRACPVALLIG